MAAALRRCLGWKQSKRSAVYLGSVAPDISLYCLTLGASIYYRMFKGWSGRDTFQYIFDQLFFQDTLWIFCHNLLHAPLSLGVVHK